MSRIYPWSRRFATIAMLSAVVLGFAWSGGAEAAGHVCVAEFGVVLEQRGTATCYADATSQVSVTGANSHVEGRVSSDVEVSGKGNSVMVTGSDVFIKGNTNTVGGDANWVSIVGKGNTVVTFESKVDISGNDNSLFDAVLSSVYISGNGNFGQLVSTSLELSGNRNTLTGLVGCSIVLSANRVTSAGTCTVP